MPYTPALTIDAAMRSNAATLGVRIEQPDAATALITGPAEASLSVMSWIVRRSTAEDTASEFLTGWDEAACNHFVKAAA